jgi:hypothetical protein
VWHGTLADRTCPATASDLADLAGGGTVVVVVGAIDSSSSRTMDLSVRTRTS